MKFSSKKGKIFLVILGVVLIVLLNFYKEKVRNFFHFVSSPIQKTFWQTSGKVSGFFATIPEVKNLKKENENLKTEIQEKSAENAILVELKKENDFLRDALKIGLENDFQLALAQVMGKDISQDILTIDKGTKDGIAADMPVITQQKILVGKIGQVCDNFSKVILISNKGNSFDAKTSGTDVYGIIKGEGNFKIIFDLVPADKEINKNDTLVTTATGGIFPEGILIGKISEVKKSDTSAFQQAEVLPSFDINNLNYLFVIK